MFVTDNISVLKNGHLAFCGLDTVELASRYSTPLYLLDENMIRSRCKMYSSLMKKYFGETSGPLYAGKALSFKGIYKIIKEEGIGIDAVSCGEIYTALSAGFDPSMIYFHGNNKTDSDIEYAIEHNIGCFISDCPEELLAISKASQKYNRSQDVIIRLCPGVDPHTHAKISTGSVDSKFGINIKDGQAHKAVELALSLPGINLIGFHSHIGSQIVESDPYCDEIKTLLEFVSGLKDSLNYDTKVINIGGGFGVKYKENDPCVDYEDNIKKISDIINLKKNQLGLYNIRILMEPGRSIVAEAGMTLYTVGSFRHTEGLTSYTSIDGGMADNPRYALYESPYTVYSCNKAELPYDTPTHLVGRCCESGDIIQKDIKLPKPERGDVVAVACTGAYNYSMSSNYNRLCKPAMVIIKDGVDRLAVKRETFEDLIKNEI